MHPILDALERTPHDWIKKLLFTFNEGNIGKFEALAPLFPKEVCLCVFHAAAGAYRASVADLARELPISPAEDLSHGAYRICVQEGCV